MFEMLMSLLTFGLRGTDFRAFGGVDKVRVSSVVATFQQTRSVPSAYCQFKGRKLAIGLLQRR